MKKKDYKLKKEFIMLSRDILRSDEFKQMQKYKSHVNSTLYRHSVKVAYLCFAHCKKRNIRLDFKELVSGALLHDYYLYNLHEKGKHHNLHWIKHPKIALKNATTKYNTLSKVQRDMIKNHMFPLTLSPPKTKAGWLICYYDKVSAIDDLLHSKNKRRKNEK